MDTNMLRGAGSRALKDALIPSTHDGQCKLDMKQVVVMVSCSGSRNMGMVCDIVIGLIGSWDVVQYFPFQGLLCFGKGNMTSSWEGANGYRCVIKVINQATRHC